MLKHLVLALLLTSSACPSFGQEVKPTSSHPIKLATSAPSSADSSTPQDKSDEGEPEDDIFEVVEVNDPLEFLNRGMYLINGALDICLIKPLALGYRWIFPEVIRNRVEDFMTNLHAPISFVNHILQAEPKRAFDTLSTFVINTTIGGLGFYNTAQHLNITSVKTNFNETLGRWGIDTGPYLVLPILGSSSFRGAVGLAGDYMSDPATLYFFFNGPSQEAVAIGSYIRTGVYTIHEREKYIEIIEELQKTSEDMYATLRSIYFQKQKSKIEELKHGANTTEINKADDTPGSQQSID